MAEALDPFPLTRTSRKRIAQQTSDAALQLADQLRNQKMIMVYRQIKGQLFMDAVREEIPETAYLAARQHHLAFNMVQMGLVLGAYVGNEVCKPYVEGDRTYQYQLKHRLQQLIETDEGKVHEMETFLEIAGRPMLSELEPQLPLGLLTYYHQLTNPFANELNAFLRNSVGYAAEIGQSLLIEAEIERIHHR